MRFPSPTLLAAIAAGLLLYGCTAGEPTAPPPPASGGTAQALLPLSYTHVKDSDGGTPNPGVEVTLLFEPNGVAQMYVADETDAIAYRGTYGYSGADFR